MISVLLPTAADLELASYLEDWLPLNVIDSHVHVHKSSGSDVLNSRASTPGQTFNCFGLDQHQEVIESFKITKIGYQAIIFGLPFLDDEQENNIFLRQKYFDNPHMYPIDCLTSQLSSNNFSLSENDKGVKTKIIGGGRENGREIIDNFPERVWGQLNDKAAFAVIHLPRNIVANLDELTFLARRYEKINFIVAHLGGFFLYDDRLPEIFTRVAKLSNVYFDTAMVTDARAIGCAISLLGCEKILFGSDAPFAYLRGSFQKREGQTVFLPDDKWPWNLNLRRESDDASHMVILDSIMAIKGALEQYSNDIDGAKESIFHTNAQRILKLAAI